ncbi:MAG TPA: outer membrane beta-barrel domain-containing protein [Polyangiales bacterium]|jgi:outer membrane beta-barrel protein|nr:outer membrane beta-barrel domain-containing protein [Polyangiales bacterium]
MRSNSGLAWILAFGLLFASTARAQDDDVDEAQPSAADTSASSSASSCIDESIRDELNARRRYRGVQKRLFQKAGRHELSFLGGVYAADLLSSSYLLSGAYTYHFTEDLGLEASFGYTRADSALVRIVETDTSFTALRLNTPVYIYEGHLLWSLAYGKLRWFSGSVSRFDLFSAFGGGVTDNQTAQGLTGSFGLGFKMFFGDWFAVRLDLRDQILQQELLGHSEIVNNLAATLGLSAFVPFSP